MTRIGVRGGGWPLERVLFALAGSVTLLSPLLAAVVSPWFLLLTAFVGVNQWLYVLVGGLLEHIEVARVDGLLDQASNQALVVLDDTLTPHAANT